MSHSKWSRRRVIKGALATGIAIPAILHIRSALAAYPERPIRFVVANTPAARPTSPRASSPLRSSKQPARPSSSKTAAAAPVATSAWAMRQAPRRMATPSCSRPTPIR